MLQAVLLCGSQRNSSALASKCLTLVLSITLSAKEHSTGRLPDDPRRAAKPLFLGQPQAVGVPSQRLRLHVHRCGKASACGMVLPPNCALPVTLAVAIRRGGRRGYPASGIPVLVLPFCDADSVIRAL